MKQPGRRKRGVGEMKDSLSKDVESVSEQTLGAEKLGNTLSLKAGTIIKKNTILPAKTGHNIVALQPIKASTLDEADQHTIESVALSKKGSFSEKKMEMVRQAVTKKGNENDRQSFHNKMNMYNMISSSLGLFGLLLQMIEVSSY